MLRLELADHNSWAMGQWYHTAYIMSLLLALIQNRAPNNTAISINKRPRKGPPYVSASTRALSVGGGGGGGGRMGG